MLSIASRLESASSSSVIAAGLAAAAHGVRSLAGPVNCLPLSTIKIMTSTFVIIALAEPPLRPLESIDSSARGLLNSTQCAP